MSTSRLFLACLAILVAATSCSSAPDKRTLQYLNRFGFGKKYFGNAEEENYATIGDTIIFQDQLHPDEIQGSQEVDIDGTILLPEVGTVHVAGFTRSDIQAIMKERYSVFYEETDIAVQIRTQGKKYFIFGMVRSQGEKTLNGDLTIFEAVMEARPEDNSSNLGRVRLMRPDPVDPIVITVNVNDMLETADSTFNVQIQEYDIIFVPPTLLAELAFFIEDLLFPFTTVIRAISSAFFGFAPQGRGRRGRNNNAFGTSVFGF